MLFDAGIDRANSLTFSGLFLTHKSDLFFTFSGYCAGYLSAFVIAKVYKNFNFNFALIIPLLVMIYFGYENILASSKVSMSFLINSFARDLAMLATYYILLKDYSLSKI